jgi:hypothetical protein
MTMSSKNIVMPLRYGGDALSAAVSVGRNELQWWRSDRRCNWRPLACALFAQLGGGVRQEHAQEEPKDVQEIWLELVGYAGLCVRRNQVSWRSRCSRGAAPQYCVLTTVLSRQMQQRRIAILHATRGLRDKAGAVATSRRVWC